MIFFKGNEADPRMRAASKRRGIEITSLSRPIKSSDFVEFDLILAMDRQNKGRVSDILICIWWNVFSFTNRIDTGWIFVDFDGMFIVVCFNSMLFGLMCLVMEIVVFVLEDILEAFNRWKFRDPIPDDAHKKVSKLKQQ